MASDFSRPRASKANLAGDSLSACETGSTKDIEEENGKGKETLQGDLMNNIQTTETENAVPKTVASVTKDKQKSNCRKHRTVKGEQKADTDHDAMKGMVINIKKRRESFKLPDAVDLSCQILTTSLHELIPPDFCCV